MNNQSPKAKLLTAIVAGLAVGFGGATLNFEYVESPDSNQLLDCLTTIDTLIKSHDNNLDKVVSSLMANVPHS